MHRLTREVRFAVNAADHAAPSGKPTNSYGGFPTISGLGHFFTLRLTLAGNPSVASQYVVNIKEIDAAARERAVPLVTRAVRETRADVPRLVSELFAEMSRAWDDAPTVDALELRLSPFLAHAVVRSELPMVRLSQKFEFSATHRLHNPALSDEENCRTYGKCNNPHGHGHNYEVQVTLAGTPGKTGLLIDVPAFERIVATTVIDRFDHKNLNVELPEFRDVIPSVENIASTIFRLLKPPLGDAGAKLASVTVWETPKTWCEYSE
jgi:6-pyruvoyltetrahydropterin/6-carboxytetrahydropterin synthase